MTFDLLFNNIVSGAYLKKPCGYYIDNAHTHHSVSVDVSFAGHDFRPTFIFTFTSLS